MAQDKFIQGAYEEYLEWQKEEEERLGFKPILSFKEFCEAMGYVQRTIKH